MIIIIFSASFSKLSGARVVDTKTVGSESTVDIQSIRRLVGAVDYIKTDYTVAVDNHGKILDQFEYDEMKELSQDALSAFALVQQYLLASERRLLEELLTNLTALIEARQQPAKVMRVCQDLRRVIAKSGLLNDIPSQYPDIELAKVSFERHCAVCHGATGKGDGPSATALIPKPANFHSEDLMGSSSPAKFYNLIVTGIEAMPSFDHLPEAEKWSLAFYLHTLRWADTEVEGVVPQDMLSSLSLHSLANMTDVEVLQHLESASSSMQPSESQLVWTRLQGTFDRLVPLASSDLVQEQVEEQGVLPMNPLLQDLMSAHRLVLRGLTLVAEGSFEAARQAVLDAYLQHYEAYERSPQSAAKEDVARAEALFLGVRSDLRLYQEGGASLDSARSGLEELSGILMKIIALESAASHRGGQYTSEMGSLSWDMVFSSMVIILREGLEAFLIIAALLAILTQMGHASARRWVHLGWLLALLAGVAAYVVLQRVLHVSGLAHELMEGMFTAIAVVLLFYTGFWLMSQSEHMRWQSMVKSKCREALATRKLGVLVFISFVAVFRESVETILFYEALKKTGDTFSIALGFVCGVVILITICRAIIKYNIRLPLQTFFKVTSAFMVAIAIVLAGKSVMEFMEADLISATRIHFLPRLDWLGFFPYWESVIAQLGLILLVAGYLIMRRSPPPA
ncbi:MAG: FTR1 family protein [Zetaproteobacteria bacterium]|nr:FTR1 family protein [Zetaproteobacteria bacterium]